MTVETFEKAEELRCEISNLQDIIEVLKDSTADENSRLCAVNADGVLYPNDLVNAIRNTAYLSDSMRDKLISVVREEIAKKELEFSIL